MMNEKNYMIGECMICLHEPGGVCSLHKQVEKKVYFDDAWAVTCQHLCDIGLFTRESPNTCSVNFGLFNK